MKILLCIKNRALFRGVHRYYVCVTNHGPAVYNSDPHDQRINSEEVTMSDRFAKGEPRDLLKAEARPPSAKVVKPEF